MDLFFIVAIKYSISSETHLFQADCIIRVSLYRYETIYEFVNQQTEPHCSSAKRQWMPLDGPTFSESYSLKEDNSVHVRNVAGY